MMKKIATIALYTVVLLVLNMSLALLAQSICDLCPQIERHVGCCSHCDMVHADDGVCSRCDGSRKCWSCLGTGKDNSGNSCYICSGSGKCWYCSGTGKS